MAVELGDGGVKDRLQSVCFTWCGLCESYLEGYRRPAEMHHTQLCPDISFCAAGPGLGLSLAHTRKSTEWHTRAPVRHYAVNYKNSGAFFWRKLIINVSYFSMVCFPETLFLLKGCLPRCFSALQSSIYTRTAIRGHAQKRKKLT